MPEDSKSRKVVPESRETRGSISRCDIIVTRNQLSAGQVKASKGCFRGFSKIPKNSQMAGTSSDPTSRLALFVAQTKVTGTPIRRADTLLFCHLCFADRLQRQREKEGEGGRERERGLSYTVTATNATGQQCSRVTRARPLIPYIFCHPTGPRTLRAPPTRDASATSARYGPPVERAPRFSWNWISGSRHEFLRAREPPPHPGVRCRGGEERGRAVVSGSSNLFKLKES